MTGCWTGCLRDWLLDRDCSRSCWSPRFLAGNRTGSCWSWPPGVNGPVVTGLSNPSRVRPGQGPRPWPRTTLYTLKWSILQYAIVGPLVAIVGVITNAFGLYCESGPFDPHFAHVYLEVVNFLSNKCVLKILAHCFPLIMNQYYFLRTFSLSRPDNARTGWSEAKSKILCYSIHNVIHFLSIPPGMSADLSLFPESFKRIL